VTTVIRARLMVALHLVDTTTGRDIEDTDVRFIRDGTLQRPMNKGNGIWVFTGDVREDFLMSVEVRGFDKEELSICYETLDPKLPILDVFLMPSENNRRGGEVVRIEGSLSGLRSIEAVPVTKPVCMFHEVNEKKGVVTMTLLPKIAGSKVELDNTRYAVIFEDEQRYEVFEVISTKSRTQVLLKEDLQNEHKTGEKIGRIVYGRAGPKGAFLLKVRDDGTSLPYILRFVTGRGEYFRPIDFGLEQGMIDLMDKAVKVKPKPREETDNE